MSCVYPNCVETRLYTRQNQLRAIGQEQRCENCPKNADETNALPTDVTCTRLNKAVYTAESVACDWAGAVMPKLPEKRRKNECVTDQPTDQPTDRPTDGPTQLGIESHARD